MLLVAWTWLSCVGEPSLLSIGSNVVTIPSGSGCHALPVPDIGRLHARPIDSARPRTWSERARSRVRISLFAPLPCWVTKLMSPAMMIGRLENSADCMILWLSLKMACAE